MNHSNNIRIQWLPWPTEGIFTSSRRTTTPKLLLVRRGISSVSIRRITTAERQGRIGQNETNERMMQSDYRPRPCAFVNESTEVTDNRRAPTNNNIHLPVVIGRITSVSVSTPVSSAVIVVVSPIEKAREQMRINERPRRFTKKELRKRTRPLFAKMPCRMLLVETRVGNPTNEKMFHVDKNIRNKLHERNLARSKDSTMASFLTYCSKANILHTRTTNNHGRILRYSRCSLCDERSKQEFERRLIALCDTLTSRRFQTYP
jgi:hypothetical protein